MKVYLVIGQCGVGKTWLMKQLITKFGATKKASIGKVKFNLNPDENIYVLGNYDGSMFEGSDKLSMAVAGDFEYFYHFINTIENPIVICEGDRFTNKTFMNLFKPTIVKIEGDGSEGRKIRRSTQSDRQLKSIATRVNNINPTVSFENSQLTLDYFQHEIKL